MAFQMIDINLLSIILSDIKSIIPEKQNKEYDSAIIITNNYSYRIRKAKITPKKTGAFVAVYERENNKNRPFNYDEFTDYLLVICQKDTKIGVFIFDKEILKEKNILSYDKAGKMAFRLYPLWDKPLSKQAIKTQKWQSNYFKMIQK